MSGVDMHGEKQGAFRLPLDLQRGALVDHSLHTPLVWRSSTQKSSVSNPSVTKPGLTLFLMRSKTKIEVKPYGVFAQVAIGVYSRDADSFAGGVSFGQDLLFP